MKPESKIKKGKRFEKYIAEEIEKMGFGRASREIGSGSGKRKGDIAANLEFLLECKNQQKMQWWQSIEQAKDQAMQGNWNKDKWALIAKDPGSPEESPRVIAVIDFWEFLKLLAREREPITEEPDREMKYLLGRLRTVAQQVVKRIPDNYET